MPPQAHHLLTGPVPAEHRPGGNWWGPPVSPGLTSPLSCLQVFAQPSHTPGGFFPLLSPPSPHSCHLLQEDLSDPPAHLLPPFPAGGTGAGSPARTGALGLPQLNRTGCSVRLGWRTRRALECSLPLAVCLPCAGAQSSAAMVGAACCPEGVSAHEPAMSRPSWAPTHQGTSPVTGVRNGHGRGHLPPQVPGCPGTHRCFSWVPTLPPPGVACHRLLTATARSGRLGAAGHPPPVHGTHPSPPRGVPPLGSALTLTTPSRHRPRRPRLSPPDGCPLGCPCLVWAPHTSNQPAVRWCSHDRPELELATAAQRTQKRFTHTSRLASQAMTKDTGDKGWRGAPGRSEGPGRSSFLPEELGASLPAGARSPTWHAPQPAAGTSTEVSPCGSVLN